MAGHSKWANIKHRKAAQDSKRGKIFTRLIREITVAAREGGSDPTANPRLRLAMDKALSNNMTKDTIEKAAKRGAGELGDQNLETIVYEGYAAGGVAVIVECMTDNKNRSVSGVRHAFNKYGGNLGSSGSVSYIFKKLGIIIFNDSSKEDVIFETAMEAGALDIINNDDSTLEVQTNMKDFIEVKQKLIDAGLTPDNAEITNIPDNTVQLDVEGANKVMNLIDALEELDDVQEVWHNGDISDDVLQQLNN